MLPTGSDLTTCTSRSAATTSSCVVVSSEQTEEFGDVVELLKTLCHACRRRDTLLPERRNGGGGAIGELSGEVVPRQRQLEAAENGVTRPCESATVVQDHLDAPGRQLQLPVQRGVGDRHDLVGDGKDLGISQPVGS